MRKLLIGLSAALVASASVPALSNTLTTNYSLNKPTIGADANNWGTLTNSNWDSLDSIVFGMCPKTGCTFTGGVFGTTFDATTPAGSTATLTGVLSSGVLTASAVSGTIILGATLAGTGVNAGTILTSQLTGTSGGAGTYQTSGTQTISSEAMTATSAISTGGFRLRANGPSGNGFLQFTDSTGASEWGHFGFQPNTGGVDTGPAAWTGGAFTFNSPLNVTGATTLSGGVSGNLSVTGSPTFGTNTSAGVETINGPAGSGREISILTAGVSRWLFGVTTDPESGSNAGSNFFIQSDTDAGGFLGLPLTINRATGLVSVSSLSVGGKTPVTVSSGTITANTGSCAGLSSVTGNTSAGTFHTTASCPVNGTITLSFPFAASNGWSCVLQESNLPGVEFRQNAFTTSSCSMVVLNSATGSNDGVIYLAMPF